MASIVKIKRSSVQGKAPTTSDIQAGEIALNTRDGKLFSSDGSAVFEIGANLHSINVGTGGISVGNGAFSLPTTNGSTGQVLVANSSGAALWSDIQGAETITLTGDVTGTASFSANAVTVTTQLEEDVSTARLSVNNYITLSKNTSPPAHNAGTVFYGGGHECLVFMNNEADVRLQIGQESWIRVYNNTGNTIFNGTPCYLTGHLEDTHNIPTCAPGDASDPAKYNISGLATHDIENGTYGFLTEFGMVNDVDTSAFTEDERIFLGFAAPGTLVQPSPSYPNYPMCVGTVIHSSNTNGKILVELQNHSVNSFRVLTDARVDGDMTVAGDLTVLGTQTIASSQSIGFGSPFAYLNVGDTIGANNTNFSGTGLDDATFVGYYEGNDTKTYYVQIDGVGTGTGGVDTFKWSYNSDLSSPQATTVDITGADQLLADNISIHFEATTGHTSGDTWSGGVAPINVDSGWASNRNDGTGYTHMGVFFDVTDKKFKFFQSYGPEPTGDIDTANTTFQYATVVANTFQGGLVGNASTATALATGRTISITGDVAYTSGSFDGTTNVTGTGTLSTASGSTLANYTQVANTNAQIAAVYANTNAWVANTVTRVNTNASDIQTANNRISSVLANTNAWIANTVTRVNTNASDIQTANNRISSVLANTNAWLTATNNSISAINTNLGQKLGATASVTLSGDVTGSASFSSNAVSITTDIANTGTPTGTFGSASKIPVITVAADGRITNISNTNVAGVSGFSYAAANNTFTISTADGSSYDAVIPQSEWDPYITVANVNTTLASYWPSANIISHVSSEIAALVNSAPSTLDTLGELASALSNNENFATTVTTNLGQKLGATASVTLTGAVTGSASFSSNAVSIATSVNHNHDSDYVNVSGDTMTGALNFGDNVKAQFGANNDLQIYHDGSHSFVTDTGTGNLRLQGTNLALQNAAGTKNYLLGSDGGATTLYYDNAAKLATTSTGIDVTGTVTADGVDIDGALTFGPNNVTASGATTAIDMTASNFHIITMNASTTLSFNNLSSAVASSGTFVIKQDGIGGRSFTLPAVCKTPIGGQTITQATGANTTSILSYIVVSASEVLVNYVGDFA